MTMRLRPILLSFVRRRSEDDGDDEKTLDGTVDFHGKPASRRRTGGWKGAIFFLVGAVMQNLAYFGVGINLVTYLTTVMHESNATAARNVSNWNGTGYVASVLAAFIADAYLGRFMGAAIACVLFNVSLAMLCVSASVTTLRPPQCANKDLTCQHASVGQGVFLYAGLYMMSLGSGGILVNGTALGADQFDEEDEIEKQQQSSFFNWLYQSIFVGSFIANTLFVYIQENVSFGLGWGIVNGAMVLALVFLLMGVRLYRYHAPGGNPLSRVAQVLVACVRKRRLKMENPDELYEILESESVIKGSRKLQHSSRFRFLDKAAIVTEADRKNKGEHWQESPWRLCTVTQVEEVKFVLRVLPIFLSTIMYTTCYSQISTLFIEQGSTMDRSLGPGFTIPAASLAVFESVSVLFWVVMYDQQLVPFLRKHTGDPRGMSELKRVGIGLVLSILSMSCAAVVEIERLRTARAHGLLDDPITPVPMSVFWEIPQYFIMGASEVMTYIGLREFFYNQAPDAIRSLGTSLSMLGNALGNFLSSLLVTIVGHISRQGRRPGWVADNLNRGRIDLFYWLLAVMSFINLLAFIACARQYEYTITQGPIECGKASLDMKDRNGADDVHSPLSALDQGMLHSPS